MKRFRGRCVSAFLLTAAAIAVVATGCGGVAESGFNGAQLAKPVALPAISLTDTNGQSYQLGGSEKGVLTLLYFGYTHCPDVCPATMADIGSALRSLSDDDAKMVRVVFVTSDPERDTPAVLKSWLANFDQGLAFKFIGLTGKLADIDSYGEKLGVPLDPPVKKADGTIEVMHGAQTLAFSPQDGLAHLVWTNGTLPTQYASDIRSLLRRVP